MPEWHSRRGPDIPEQRADRWTSGLAAALATILMVLAALSLAGCGSADATADSGCTADDQCGPEERCAAGVCTRVRCGCAAVWSPVCGVDGATYANTCEAACAGADIAYQGTCTTGCYADQDCRPDQRCTADVECLSPPTCDEPAGCSATCYGRCVDADCGCSPVTEPVCGSDGATYPNECLAKCGGVDLFIPGECAQCKDLGCAPDCPAGQQVDADGCPTCECAPLLCASDGRCPEGMRCDPLQCVPSCPECDDCQPQCVPSPTCACPPGGESVCGDDGQTYESSCVAECNGVAVAHVGACWPWCQASTCDLSCPWGYLADAGKDCLLCACYQAPRQICGDSRDCGTGQWCNPMSCAPSCPGCLDCQPACEPMACPCQPVWEPVCDDLGWTFASACEASCAGVASARLGACGASCQCPPTWSPVCGIDGVTYANACQAECAAVSVAAHGRCECVGACTTPSPVCGADRRSYACGIDSALCNGVDVLWSGSCDAPELCTTDQDCGAGRVCDPSACAPECVGCSGCAPACRPG